jgi:hypothetical protein
MNKIRIRVTVVLLLTLYIAPMIALYLEVKSHQNTQRQLQMAETDLNEAWQMVQELRSTLSAMQ